jgi:hypothetical protein
MYVSLCSLSFSLFSFFSLLFFSFSFTLSLISFLFLVEIFKRQPEVSYLFPTGILHS